MWINFRLLIFRGFVIIDFCAKTTPTQNPARDEELPVSLALKVCNDKILLSEPCLLYVVNLNQNPRVPLLIKTLHGSSISTILINHYGKLTDFFTTQRKLRFMFFLNDIQEAMSVVLNSASRKNQLGQINDGNDVKQSKFFTTPNFSNNRRPEIHTFTQIPRFCVKIEGQLEFKTDAMCEEEITLSLTELEGTSELADRNYNVTEGLYNNPIWNSNNLLIFVLNNFDQNDSSSNTSLGAYCKKERDIAGMHDALVLTFKFFWRFFRGHKTVICLAINCARYDPFTQKIVWQSDEDNEIFDFSVNDLHGKSMRVVDQSLVETKGLYDGSFEFSLADIISNIFISLESSINCRFDFDFVFLQELNPEPNYYEAGHKGADFHFLNLVATQDTVNL